MYLAQKEWFLSTYPPISSSWVPDLLQFAETLGEPCLALLEGNEKDAQRTYLAFGEGWVLSPQSTGTPSLASPPSLDSPPSTNTLLKNPTSIPPIPPNPPDPLEHLRSFTQEH